MEKCQYYKKGECRFEKDGICFKHRSKIDNLFLHCSGYWAREKIKHFRYYSEMFSTGMKNKWPRRYFLDLFSGPGKCIIREGLREIKGTCLSISEIKNPFTHYYLIDNNSDCTKSLEKRLHNQNNFSIIQGDCNIVVKDVLEKIIDPSLSLAIIDPDSLQFNFETYNVLSTKKIDLIINYPVVAVERTVSSIIKSGLRSETMDKFHPGWRKIVSRNGWGDSKRENIRALIKNYISKVEKLGYFSNKLSDSVIFKNSKNASLYYLVVFAKDKMGIEFWKKKNRGIKSKEKQTSLF